MAVEFRPDLQRFLAEFVEAHRGLRLGKMFGAPAGFAGRSMFACVFEDGLRCRLPPEIARRELARQTKPSASSAKQIRGWVFYRPRSRAAMARLVPTLEIAARYAAEQKLGINH